MEKNIKKYSIGLYEKAMPCSLTWAEKLTAAKEAGYDFVEISIDETEEKLRRLEMSKEERLELIKVMFEIGIPIRTLCLSGHRKYPLGSNDPETVKRGIEIMEKALQFADDLGIRMIMLAGYDVYYEESSHETGERFRKNLKRVVDMAAKYGILLGFETMETEFMNTVEKSMEYVRGINSPYLSVYPDIGNITNAAVRYQKDMIEDLKSGSGHLAAMHLKETLPGKFRDLFYGEGHVDFDLALQTAWELGIRKFVTEFWYLGNKSWQKDLKYANEFMAGKLNEVSKRC